MLHYLYFGIDVILIANRIIVIKLEHYSVKIALHWVTFTVFPDFVGGFMSCQVSEQKMLIVNSRYITQSPRDWWKWVWLEGKMRNEKLPLPQSPLYQFEWWWMPSLWYYTFKWNERWQATLWRPRDRGKRGQPMTMIW